MSLGRGDWYAQVFEATSSGIFVYSMDGRLIDLNSAACRMHKRTRDEMLSMAPHEFIHPDTHHVFAEFRQAIEAGREYRGEARGVASDGTVFDVEVYGVPLLIDGERVAFSSLIDITEQKRLRSQLAQRDRLEALGTLAGGVAHDFNNVLTVIGTATDTARSSPSSEELAVCLDEIAAATALASDLTRQLLAFSSAQPLSAGPVDLNEVVERLRPMLTRVLPDDIEMRVELATSLPSVMAEEAQLEQVVLNLCINAREAMTSGGSLVVRTGRFVGDDLRKSGEYALLEVTDTGAGMDPAVRDRIFDPFFSTKERGRGTGLGLATVHGIVRQHGGHIVVRDHEPTGTSFRIFLPASSRPAPAKVRLATPAKPAFHAERILVVDDEPALLRVVGRALRRAGCTVVESDPSEIDRAMAGGPFDLVLSDVVMRGMAGPALYQRLRAVQSDLRVLYMSGYSADVSTQRTFDTDAPLLAKPFTIEGLLRAVRDALDREPVAAANDQTADQSA